MEFVAELPEIKEEPIQEWSIAPDPVLKNRVIDDIIHFLGQRHSLGPSVLFKYRLCLDEAITNAVTHGARGVDDPKIKIQFFWSETSWVLLVEDPGEGFDPQQVPNPTDPGNEFREQGRGILILERYTDRLVYSEGGRIQAFWMKTDDLK